MKIGILGTGVVAQTIAEKLIQLGHEITLGTRDVSVTMERNTPDMFGRPGFGDWHRQHTGIRIATFEEAAIFGELTINATNGGSALEALKLAGSKNLEKKVLIDVSNPLDFSKGMPPSLLVSNTDSLGEQIQRAYPQTMVVKTLNTMNAWIMVNPQLLPEDHNVFLSGNDSAAKLKVREILQSFGWKEKDILDMGDITTARGTEQLVAMWVRILNAFKNPMFNFKIVMGEPPKQS